MKILDRYLIRETIPPFLLALAVFTFLLAINPMLIQAQDLLAKGVGLAEVAFLLLTLIPQSLAITIPMAFLAGLLMALGRLSGDREAVALLACGVSPLRMLRAAALLALIAGGLDMYVLTSVVPDANQRFRLETFKLLVKQSEGDIKPGLFYEGFPGKVLYVRESRPGGGWSGVLLADTTKPGRPVVTLADSGYLDIDAPNQQVSIVLPGESIRYVPGDEGTDTYDMGRARDLRFAVPADTVFGNGTIGLDRGVNEMTIAELRQAEAKRRAAGLSPHNEIIHRHQMFSFPVACVVFSLVGIALGLHTRKEGKLGALTVGVAVIFIYYAVMELAEGLAKGGHLRAEWARWVPNILVGLFGIAAVWWRMRSTGSEWTPSIPNWLRPGVWRARFAQRATSRRVANIEPRSASYSRGWSLPRPRLLDLYVTKRYLGVVFLSFFGFLGLYYIGTLIDRSDHLLKGQAGLGLLFQYFYFSTPQYVAYIFPMATLVAVLATIGGLAKTSELTVMRACGVSLYRVAAPLLVMAILWSGALFLLNDRVLARANRRAQAIDDTIRGNPPHPIDLVQNASWLADQSGRIYYYAHMDVLTKTLNQLSIFETAPKPFRLLSHTNAQSAIFSNGTWRVRNGWTEYFPAAGKTARETFTAHTMQLASFEEFAGRHNEGADLMTFGELRKYIAELGHSGFSLADSRVRLQERIAFPLVTIIMTVLGVPFGITTGRRGALYGIGLAIMLGAGYWLLNTFFMAVGQADLMPAALAAWAANILFLAAAGYLTLTVRT